MSTHPGDCFDADGTVAGARLHTQSILIEIFKEEDIILCNGAALSENDSEMSYEDKGNHQGTETPVDAEGALSSTGARSLHRQEIQIQIEGLKEEIIQGGTMEGQSKPAWEVHEQIGKGGFGVVYRGTWRGLDVAIKRIVLQVRGMVVYFCPTFSPSLIFHAVLCSLRPILTW